MFLSALMFFGLLFNVMELPSMTLANTLEVGNVRYVIEDKSELFISGTSNVNSFCCTSNEQLRPGDFSYEKLSEGYYSIANGELDLSTAMMDCGGKQITKDFKKALRADEFPEIKIIFNAMTLYDFDKDRTDWQKALADTDIIIAGCSNHKFLNIQFKQINDGLLEAHADTKLCISDFGIEPPTALLGLVKVDDEVEINMRMFISMQPI